MTEEEIKALANDPETQKWYREKMSGKATAAWLKDKKEKPLRGKLDPDPEPEPKEAPDDPELSAGVNAYLKPNRLSGKAI